ncbi:MAG: response regulator [Candidatus Omnitrophica bacterium]|nr:response regulator [Candidatus Omnitrophota bacterium]
MPRVLVVDDELEMVLVLQKFFTRCGCDVSTASHGANALKILESGTKIDILILDMRMPVMRGVTLLKEMDTRGIKLPVIVLTGSLNFSGFAETMQVLGYSEDDIVFKPVDLEMLLGKVREKLGMKDLGLKNKSRPGKTVSRKRKPMRIGQRR